MVGMYVSRNNVNTVDTLHIQVDGSYVQELYRMTDKSLIYRNVGNWMVKGGYIIFSDFYCDEDDVHSKEEGNFEEVLITTQLPIETKAGKTILHHLAMYDHIYLEKIR